MVPSVPLEEKEEWGVPRVTAQYHGKLSYSGSYYCFLSVIIILVVRGGY